MQTHLPLPINTKTAKEHPLSRFTCCLYFRTVTERNAQSHSNIAVNTDGSVADFTRRISFVHIDAGVNRFRIFCGNCLFTNRIQSAIIVILNNSIILSPFRTAEKHDAMKSQRIKMNFRKINIITGHYGSGKTNVSVNMALDLAEKGEKVTVVDLDIVNPYFRTADFKELFGEHNISLTVPTYANSNLDIPALGFDMNGIADREGYIIIDVGGDDEGAKALGRYRKVFEKYDTQMLYVINRCRYLTKEPAEALQLMYEIENASGMKCDGIINNTNLGRETDRDIVLGSVAYADEVCREAGLPLVAVTAEAGYLDGIDKAYPVNIYVKKLWEEFGDEAGK